MFLSGSVVYIKAWSDCDRKLLCVRRNPGGSLIFVLIEYLLWDCYLRWFMVGCLSVGSFSFGGITSPFTTQSTPSKVQWYSSRGSRKLSNLLFSQTLCHCKRQFQKTLPTERQRQTWDSWMDLWGILFKRW